MTKIFKVISNIKHNGDDFLKGSFIADEFAGSEILVNDGVLKEIVGAETIEEAKAIDAESQAIEESAEEVVEPKDTWAPEADEPIVATGTIVNDEETEITATDPVEEEKTDESTGPVEPSIDTDNL